MRSIAGHVAAALVLLATAGAAGAEVESGAARAEGGAACPPPAPRYLALSMFAGRSAGLPLTAVMREADRPAGDGGDAVKAVVRNTRYVVFFAYGWAAVDANADKVIDAVARLARLAGTRSLVITGHADRSGPRGQNERLSLRRADAVRAALIRAGLRPELISVAARGETAPLVPTGDGVREARNRRVEIELR